jgi:putative transposase
MLLRRRRRAVRCRHQRPKEIRGTRASQASFSQRRMAFRAAGTKAAGRMVMVQVSDAVARQSRLHRPVQCRRYNRLLTEQWHVRSLPDTNHRRGRHRTRLAVVAGSAAKDNGGMKLCTILCCLLRGLLVGRAALLAENLALRQQLALLQRERRRPRWRWRDRWFWMVLAKLWRGWRSALVLVQPDTVVRWQRTAFRCYWRWKSRRPPGRPGLAREVRRLIRRMSRDNALWGAPRIRAELRLLGHEVAESSVAKYVVRRRDKPLSQTWRTFLRNHFGCLAAMDFLVVPTATFRLLFVFLVLRHDRRRVVHFNITEHPTAEWVSRQLVQAFPYDEAPRYLIRDRDGAYGEAVRHTLKSLGIEEVVTAPRSPWQKPYCERVVGTIRRDLLDHVIALNERHLMRLLRNYLVYYHDARCHRGLEGNAPNPRAVEGPERGQVVAEPMVGGLHHRYRRAA